MRGYSDPVSQDHSGNHGCHPHAESGGQTRHGRGQYRCGPRHGKGNSSRECSVFQHERRGRTHCNVAAGAEQADRPHGQADPERRLCPAQYLQDHGTEERYGGHCRYGEDLPTGGKEALCLRHAYHCQRSVCQAGECRRSAGADDFCGGSLQHLGFRSGAHLPVPLHLPSGGRRAVRDDEAYGLYHQRGPWAHH